MKDPEARLLLATGDTMTRVERGLKKKNTAFACPPLERDQKQRYNFSRPPTIVNIG